MTAQPQVSRASVERTHYRPRAIWTGTLAYILHRITGVFLVLYLFMHIIVIGQSVRGEQAFNDALHFVQSPVFVLLDAGLSGIVTFHALNGLRIIAFDIGWGIRLQKALFWASLLVAVAVFAVSLVVARKLLG